MYQSLYRKYRPSNFDEVVGQEVPVKILKNAIKNNRIAHAYIFAGIRGTGKTSIAKIFAKTVNCLDPVEMKPCGKCAPRLLITVLPILSWLITTARPPAVPNATSARFCDATSEGTEMKWLSAPRPAIICGRDLMANGAAVSI